MPDFFGDQSDDTTDFFAESEDFFARKPKKAPDLFVGRPAAPRPPMEQDAEGRYVLPARPEPAGPEDSPAFYTDREGRRRPLAEKPLEWLAKTPIKPLEKVAGVVKKYGPALLSGASPVEGAAAMTRAASDTQTEPEKFGGELMGGMVPQTPLDVGLTLSPFVAARAAKGVATLSREGMAMARAAQAARNEPALAAALTQVERARKAAEASGAISEASSGAFAALGAPTALRGAGTLAEGVQEGDPSKIGRGIFETGMGAVGVRAGVHGLRAPAGPPQPSVSDIRAEVGAARRASDVQARVAKENADIVSQAVEDSQAPPRPGGTPKEPASTLQQPPQAPQPIQIASDVGGSRPVQPQGPPLVLAGDEAVGRRVPADVRTFDAGEGFQGLHRDKTGTFRLSGPQGEVAAGRILPDRIEMSSIGKGKAADSRTAVEALRRLGREQGSEVYFTSQQLSVTGGKFRERMMARGDLIQTEKGLLLKGTERPLDTATGAEVGPLAERARSRPASLERTRTSCPRRSRTPRRHRGPERYKNP